MSRSIYKYRLSPDGYTELDLPKGAKPLWVQDQYDSLYLWALIDPDASASGKMRKIVVVGTGHELPNASDDWRYINTFHMQSGAFVFHAFEKP